jgi:biotin carboxyl carrier protein
MRRFSITVNGQAYDVMVEEVSGAAAYAPVVAPAPMAAAPAPMAVAPATVAAPAPAAAAPAAAPVIEGGDPLSAPMPGTILDVKVAAGQSVKKGDVLVILEAMKMENEIVAPNDAVVAGIAATKGANVNAGDVLLTLK